MNLYTLAPQDLLFFRDARPFETSGGHGARWPEPSVVFDALHAALHRAFPDKQIWEHHHRFGRSSRRFPEKECNQRFGSLTTAGLFPFWKDGPWLFPAPADVVAAPEQHPHWRLGLTATTRGATNLPATFLKHTPANYAPPTKDTALPWWSTRALTDYMAGKRPARSELFTSEDLFAGEWTTGIGMDPETQTQDGQRIYSAEYLRLRPDVRCGFAAGLPMKQNGNSNDIRECIQHLFTASKTIIVGGQQRSCLVEPWLSAAPCPLPVGPDLTGTRVKWVLLTPAIWPRIQSQPDKGIPEHPGGWLPNWICPKTGQVLLRHRAGIRRVWDAEKRRTVRRAAVDNEIHAHLVAACVPKPVPIVGWTERLHLLEDEPDWASAGEARGPKSTHLAVPSGSVYYFEANSHDAAVALANALNWHGATDGTGIKNRRSTLLGEKGYGLGVCGTWDFYRHVPGRPSE